MPESKRLLFSLAHPDDESFGSGGLIARYVDIGAEVYYLCATNGDVGTVSQEMLNGYNSIAELRLAELACASKVLGFKEVFTLGYKDSGMMNTDNNRHPDSLWYNWGRKPDEVTHHVVEVIRKTRPHVVVTFNQYGGYGHPDHVAIHQATTRAFHLAGDQSYITEGLAPYQPQKMYYTGLTALQMRLRIWRVRLKGQNPRRVGRNKDIDLLRLLDYVEPKHVSINIADYLDTWAKANACHKSQGGDQRGSIIEQWLYRMLGRKQRLSRAIPNPHHDRIDETDLFEGVNFESTPMAETR